MMSKDEIIFFLNDIPKLCDEHSIAAEEAIRIINAVNSNIPLKIGDKVYEPTGRKDIPVSEYVITSFEVTKYGVNYHWKNICGFYSNVKGFSEERIGKDLFLTKEEALKYKR